MDGTGLGVVTKEWEDIGVCMLMRDWRIRGVVRDRKPKRLV